MKFKKEDRLHCKKTLSNVFQKGKYYQVGSIGYDDMVIRGIKHFTYSYLINDKEWIFYVGKNYNVFFKLYDYFYTEQEIRKLKLNKVHENKRR